MESSKMAWAELSLLLERECQTSKLSQRVPYLKDLREVVLTKKLEPTELTRISQVLLKTYRLYQDAESKALVTDIFHIVLQQQPHLFGPYKKFILEQLTTTPGTKPLADYLNLLEWVHYFLCSSAYEHGDTATLTELVIAQVYAAYGIEAVLDNRESTKIPTKAQNQSRKRTRKSCLQQCTKHFVKLFKQAQDPVYIMNIIAEVVIRDYSKHSLQATGIVVIVGALVKAILQLLSSQPALYKEFSDKYVYMYCIFIGKEIILGKQPPLPFCVEVGLSKFISEFVTQDLFAKTFVPNIEKANLRSPGQSFNILTKFYTAIDPAKINLLDAFINSKIMSQTFSSLKSSKEPVRNASLHSLIILLKSLEPRDATLESSNKLVDEIFKNIKSNLNADYKFVAAQILKNFPRFHVEVSKKIATRLSQYLSKESNESTLSALLDAFFIHYFSTNELDSNLNQIIQTNIKEKKQNLKKSWLTSFFLNAVDASGEVLTFFQEDSLSFLEDALLHLERNGPHTALACLEYITRVNEIHVDGLEQAVKDLLVSKLPSRSCLGNAYLWATLSTEVEPDLRSHGVDLLKISFKENPEMVGISILEALEERLEHSEASKESQLPYKYITPVFKALFENIGQSDVSELILVKALIATQYSGFRLKEGWANFAIMSGLDPAVVVQSNAEAIIDRIISILSDTRLAETTFGECALKAAAYASFINPSSIAPLLSNIIESDLQITQLKQLSEREFVIWRTAEGQLAEDILEKNSSTKLEDKNTKDYETLKWEESIRKEQKKKQAGKRLTREEQALVNEQLRKESEVRRYVCQIYLRLKRTLHLINELSKFSSQVENGQDKWFPIAITGLLQVLTEKNSFILVSDLAVQTFLNLSAVISKRLGSTRLFIGLAILRVNNVHQIPKNFLQEPLDELLSRVLFRIKFISDQKPLDAISLTYILPLLINVLQEGKVVALRNADKPVSRSDFAEEDKEEEHLILAMEIIGVHAMTFEDPSIPRVAILKVLLSLLALPSKAKMAKECFNALSESISVAPTPNDLELLLSSLMTPNDFVRTTILEALDNDFELESFMKFSPEVLICKFDSQPANRELAEFIWDFNKFEICEDLLRGLESFFSQADSGLRLFTARAYVAAVQHLVEKKERTFQMYLNRLMDLYREKAEPLGPILDDFGLVKVAASERKDPWEDRSTIALALKELAIILPSGTDASVQLVRFLVESGALGDRELLVRQEMKEAGIDVISLHGESKVEELIPIFDEILISDSSEASVKENVIILYGALARHLQVADDRIATIVQRLIATLDTPSEDVQQAVSACLSPLVVLFRDAVEGYINNLMEKLLNSSVPRALRKGAAWGIAGIVKGYGILSLSRFDIIRNLIEASEDKRDPVKRESVAYAFEYLSKSLEKFFEPYVIEILPNILKNLGDSVPEVREATAEATKSIMASTTSFGVKKLIPVAVSNLDEISWRTKRGSVELLGNMAYLDPAQLSSSLSTIVPEIVGVLNDSHKEVHKAADESLKRFGEVIRNPEIQKLVPVLLKAIGDPTKYTEEALDALIQTQFVHYIDGPSLALIIHVIHRGMHDRSANTKRKACKIVGNMAILVDTKDLIPYLHQLVSEVEVAMVDPVPNTRATAARALGALVERLGEEQFPDLIPRLLDTLSDETKAGDRLGSAQALAEVISGLGVSKLDELMPTILAGATNYRSYIREGFMPLLLFLPVCFGAQFATYINQIIQPILAGLADVDENIQDTALKAGKLIIRNYATKAIDLLLPELENGMFDENERIRLSSVQLSGDLLFQVTGVSSKNEFDEEEIDHTNEVTNQMVEILGQVRRDRILSALFVCRNDTSGIVRATTVDIWKALVPNTPRTIKEILPTLTSIIVAHLASSSSTLRNIAAQTLGDLVRRVGGNAMAQLLPTLEESLQDSSDPGSRQGVCVALAALIEPSPVELLIENQEVIVNIIRKTLIDSDEIVREAAASTFDVYQDVVGKIAVDEVLPYLLNRLESSTSESQYALSGLEHIMSTKSEVVFPILMKTLLSPPMDAFRATALGSLASVAGTALYKRLGSIINALVTELAKKDIDDATKSSLEASLDKVLLSVNEEQGVHPLLQQIMAIMKGENMEKHVIILARLPGFFENTVLNYELYTPDIVSNAILSLDDEDPRLVKGNFEMLLVLVKKQDKSMLEKLVKPAKEALHLTGKQGQDLLAFTLPKGPNCILPIFLHGLLYGSNDEREISALAIADIVSKTPAANLKPFVSIITGPLIRVVGERFNSDIKAAILFALNILFAKIPQFLRPFIPQLQRTFVKSLSDASNETLRLRAAKALGTLIEYQPRVDPLVVELVSGAKQATDEGVKTAMLKALLEVVSKAGDKLNETSKKNIANLVEEEMLSSNDKLAIAYARLIGSLSGILTAEEAAKILKEKVLESNLDNDTGKFGILTLNSFLKNAPAHMIGVDMTMEFVDYIIKAINAKNPYFSDNGIIAAGKLLLLNGEVKSPSSELVSEKPFVVGEEIISKLMNELAKAMISPVSNSLDTRRLSLVTVRTLARYKFDACIKQYYDLLVPSVFSCVRETVIPIKLAAEKAYLAIFNLVGDEDMALFTQWFDSVSSSGASSLKNSVGTDIPLRSIGDYTKRVGKRLANVERERIAAGGDAETMFSDHFEDENEIWAVGGVEHKSDV